MTTSSFKFKLETLQAVALVCSSDETRYSICGVNVDLQPRKPVILRATDGRRLIQHTTEWEHDAETARNFTILDSVLKALNVESHVGESALWDSGDEIRMELPDFTIITAPVDAPFPSFANVFPSPMPEEVSPQAMWLNRELIGGLLVAMEKLHRRDDAILFSAGTGEKETPLVMRSRTTIAMINRMNVNLK